MNKKLEVKPKPKVRTLTPRHKTEYHKGMGNQVFIQDPKTPLLQELGLKRPSIDFKDNRRHSLINLGLTLSQIEHRNSVDVSMPGKTNQMSEKANVVVGGHLMSVRDKRRGSHNHHKLNDASK